MFKAESLKSLAGSADWHRPVAVINADLWSKHDPWELSGCCRRMTTVNKDPIRGFTKNTVFSLGFENLADGGTQVDVDYKAPLEMQHVISSGWSYVEGAEVAFGKEDYEEYDFLAPQESRTAIGFSKDRRFLVLGAADSNIDGMRAIEWAELLLHSRKVPLEGGATVVKIEDAYRMDEGGTTALMYEKGGELIHGKGSIVWPDPTINAFGVYWQKDPPAPDPTCENSDPPQFLDVKPWQWFYEPVTRLLCHGIVDNAEYYHPGTTTNRAEFLKVLLESAFPAEDFSSLDDPKFDHFVDVAPNAWYAPYVESGSSAGSWRGTSRTASGASSPGTR
ncbi:hypothetical protein [Nannocystis pusilla]|uniref:hypothetical protein n=1 Tax=Nannocystis pusilla TaxID=889268 RepID=UPI003B7A5EAE